MTRRDTEIPLKRCLLAMQMFLLLQAGCDDRKVGHKVPLNRSALCGTYRSTDARCAGAVIVLRNDGTCNVQGFPDFQGNGSWDTEWEYTGWHLSFTFESNGTTTNNGGYEILGESPKYKLGLFLVDPDKGKIIFDKSDK